MPTLTSPGKIFFGHFLGNIKHFRKKFLCIFYFLSNSITERVDKGDCSKFHRKSENVPIYLHGHWALLPEIRKMSPSMFPGTGHFPQKSGKSALLCSRALFPRNQQVRALGTFPRNQNQKNVPIYVASRALGTFPRHQEKVHFYISGHWALF